MMKTVSSGTRLCNILLAGLALLVPAARAADLPSRLYTAADGLPDNAVGRMYSDSRGFLWFCTGDGVSRFDGTRFVNFGPEQGLLYPVVNDILEDHGSYWIATNGGLGKLDIVPPGPRLSKAQTPPSIRMIAVSSDHAANRINALFRSRSGLLWLGTDGGAFTLNMAQNGLRIRRVELALPGHSDLLVQVWSITEDADGSIWMGTKFGLVRVEPSGAIVQFPVQTTRPTDHVLALCIDRSGLLWAAHETGLIMYRPEAPNAVATASAGHAARVETTLSEAVARASLNTGVSGRLTTPSSAGQAQFLYLPDVTAPGGVTAIHLYADGRLWICTRAGVYEVSGDRWRLVDLGHKSIAGPQEILEDGRRRKDFTQRLCDLWRGRRAA
jgi:ligand-binding sensor domain-containing protein